MHSSYKYKEPEGCFVGNTFFYAKNEEFESPLYISSYQPEENSSSAITGPYLNKERWDDVGPRCFGNSPATGKILFTRYVCREGIVGSCVWRGAGQATGGSIYHNDSTMQLFLFDLGNASLTRLVEDFYSAGWGSFSPDGQKIAFIGTLSTIGWPLVWVMNTDGSNRIQLATVQGLWNSGPEWRGYFNSPDWSPDGQWIAFGSGNEIWKVKADGSEGDMIAYGVCPDWSPLVCREAPKPTWPKIKTIPKPSGTKKIKPSSDFKFRRPF